MPTASETLGRHSVTRSRVVAVAGIWPNCEYPADRWLTGGAADNLHKLQIANAHIDVDTFPCQSTFIKGTKDLDGLGGSRTSRKLCKTENQRPSQRPSIPYAPYFLQIK